MQAYLISSVRCDLKPDSTFHQLIWNNLEPNNPNCLLWIPFLAFFHTPTGQSAPIEWRIILAFLSAAYACAGHSENWCSGYSDRFRARNGGNNIFYGQSANVYLSGDNNIISINQQNDNQMGDKSTGGQFAKLCDFVLEFEY